MFGSSNRAGAGRTGHGLSSQVLTAGQQGCRWQLKYSDSGVAAKPMEKGHTTLRYILVLYIFYYTCIWLQ